jgi:hypothetical protein
VGVHLKRLNIKNLTDLLPNATTNKSSIATAMLPPEFDMWTPIISQTTYASWRIVWLRKNIEDAADHQLYTVVASNSVGTYASWRQEWCDCAKNGDAYHDHVPFGACGKIAKLIIIL